MPSKSGDPYPDWLNKYLPLPCVDTIVYIPQTESTQTLAVNNIDQHPIDQSVLWITDNQTQGLGRNGNSWFSPPQSHLTWSLALPRRSLGITDEHLSIIGLIMARSIVAAICDAKPDREWQSPNLGIKWPNDVFLNGCKIAGIMANQIKDRVVLGVGVNICPLPASKTHMISQPALSLADAGLHTDRGLWLSQIFHAWKSSLHGYESNPQAWIMEIQQWHNLYGKTLSIDGATGVAGPIKIDGSLEWSNHTGTRNIYDAHIEVLPQRTNHQ